MAAALVPSGSADAPASRGYRCKKNQGLIIIKEKLAGWQDGWAGSAARRSKREAVLFGLVDQCLFAIGAPQLRALEWSRQAGPEGEEVERRDDRPRRKAGRPRTQGRTFICVCHTRRHDTRDTEERAYERKEGLHFLDGEEGREEGRSRFAVPVLVTSPRLAPVRRGRRSERGRRRHGHDPRSGVLAAPRAPRSSAELCCNKRNISNIRFIFGF